MITLTAHLENGKKYSFEIPDGYPWVEYNKNGHVYIWTEEPQGGISGSFGYISHCFPVCRCMCIGYIPECAGHEPQLQPIHFHD